MPTTPYTAGGSTWGETLPDQAYTQQKRHIQGWHSGSENHRQRLGCIGYHEGPCACCTLAPGKTHMGAMCVCDQLGEIGHPSTGRRQAKPPLEAVREAAGDCPDHDRAVPFSYSGSAMHADPVRPCWFRLELPRLSPRPRSAATPWAFGFTLACP